MLVIKALLLLLVANGTPVIVKKLLGARLAYPLDGGKNFVDGRPLFGASKTLRGLIAAILVTTIVALVIGYPVYTGVLFAAASLGGDLVSSFIKRRLGLKPGSRALGLDQLPEATLPLLVCWQPLGMDITTAVLVIALFFVGELLLSRLFYRLNIREHPY